MRRIVGVVFLAVIVVSIAVVVVDLLASGDQGQTAITWHWTATTGTDGMQATVVTDPGRYTVQFGRGRTYTAVADCATTTGTFRIILAGRTGPLNALSITPATEDVPACGPGSLSGAFLTSLEQATSYRIADGLLSISLADGRTMTFRQ